MSESNRRKFKHPVGSLVKVVKKGESSWAIQSRFFDRPCIVLEHHILNNAQFEGDEPDVMNFVMFDDGEKFDFYDVELVRMG